MTALKATNLAEEHNLNIRGTDGIHPCESLRSPCQNSWAMCRELLRVYRLTKLPVAIE